MKQGIIYCKKCKSPKAIRFILIREGNKFVSEPKKYKNINMNMKLKDNCTRSGDLCKECYLKSKKDAFCDAPDCMANEGGKCSHIKDGGY